jgi:AraC-like DNA-binding protein
LTETLIPETPSTISSWARLIARVLDQCGFNGNAVFLEEGINLYGGDDPNARFPVSAMSRVWHRAVELTGDEGFALTLAEAADPGAYNALGLSMLSSANLGEAIHRCCLFSKVATDAGGHALVDRGKATVELVQVLSPQWSAEVTVYSVEAFNATTFRMLSKISRERFRLREVHYRHNRESERERYEAFYGAPLVFDSDEYRLVFDRGMLELSCDDANPALAESIDRWMQAYLGAFQQDTLAQAVRKLLTEKLPDGEFTQDNVARQLAMSPRSLQRGLHSEGISFKELLEQTRKELAMNYMTEPDLSLVEVCFLLGFTDQSNFTKAFKRWTGKTPGIYRQEVLS